MISVCVPTRGRPQRFAEMLASLRETAETEVEVIAAVDEDDETRDAYPTDGVEYVTVPAGTLQSGLWDVAWQRAHGDIAMHADDDIMFRTHGWDTAVLTEFEAFPDGIGGVFTANGQHGPDMWPIVWPTHPFWTRGFVEAVGYLTPPHFPSWHAEHWPVQIAQAVGRLRYVPDILIEHCHFTLGKAEVDDTYLRGASTDKWIEIEGQRLFWSAELVAEREEQIARVRARIDAARASEARRMRKLLAGDERALTQAQRQGIHDIARSDNSGVLFRGTAPYVTPRRTT